MKEYNILKINNQDYKVIIFSNSYETPLSYLEDISSELKNQSVPNCKVIFDMLLCRGNTTERYTEAIFNGKEFIKSSFKYVKIDKKNEIRKIAIDFINSNISILNNSILTSLQIKMISKGIII